MADIHSLSSPRREFIASGDRSQLRATWHEDNGYVVLSLWRGDTCVATSHLTPKEAGRLAGFITSGLADLAGTTMSAAPEVITIARPPLMQRLSRAYSSWRESVGWSLEKVARRIRSVR